MQNVINIMIYFTCNLGIKIPLSWQKIPISQGSYRYKTFFWLELPTKTSKKLQISLSIWSCLGGLEIFWRCILCLKKSHFFFTLSFLPEKKLTLRSVSTTEYQFNRQYIPFERVRNSHHHYSP